MKFGDTAYVGTQFLVDKSTKVNAPAHGGPDKWLKLKCAGGTAGWIFYDEIKNAPGFSDYHTEEYGYASDL